MLTFWETFILSLVPGILAGLKASGIAPTGTLLSILKAIDLALDVVIGEDPSPAPPTTPASHVS